MTDLINQELQARLLAISQGPWSKGLTTARQRLAPVGGTTLFSTSGRIIALDQLKLSPSNQRKSAELSKVLRVHYKEGSITDEEEIETRDAFDDALTIPQLFELAVQTGYLPEDSVRKPARSILTNLLWSPPARTFVEAYDYVAIPMLAARVGISGFLPVNPPEPTNSSLRFAGFLAHLRAFYDDEEIDTWIRFLDDFVVVDDEQDLVWEFLRGRRKTPPARIQDLLTGCQRFVTSLASAFHILSDDELGPYGLIHAYWLQKFFGYKRNRQGQFVKNTAIWGDSDSWAETFSASPHLVPPGIDPDIEKLGRSQFNNQIALLERTFEAVKHLASETRKSSDSLQILGTASPGPFARFTDTRGRIMDQQTQSKVAYATRLTLTPTGRKRSEAQLRRDLDKATSAALKRFQQAQGNKNYQLSVEAEGGFLGLGLDWVVLIALVSPYLAEGVKGFVSGASKKLGEKAGETLIEFLSKELRKRHLNPSQSTPAPEVTNVSLPATPIAGETKSRKKTRKTKKKK